MKYTLKLLWHGAILMGRVGWIVLGAFATLFLGMTRTSEIIENEETGMPEKCSPADFNHPNWTYYYGKK